MQEDNIYCPICHHKKLVKIEEYTSDFNNKKYTLYECNFCSNQFWEPLKIDPEFYKKEGDVTYALFHSGAGHLTPTLKLFLKKYQKKHVSTSSLSVLDIGCGDGVLLNELSKKEVDVWGIDIDQRSVQAARRFNLKNLYALSLEDFASIFKNKKFDIITFFDVLEHQDRPREFIGLVKKLLKPGGYIIGSVPNRDGHFIYFYRGIIDKTDLPPHHFLRFSKQSLYKFLTEQGFEVKFITDKILDEYIINLETLITGKLGNNFKIGLRKKIGQQSFFTKLLINTMKILRTIIFFPIALIVSRFLQGSHLYFEAQINE